MYICLKGLQIANFFLLVWPPCHPQHYGGTLCPDVSGISAKSGPIYLPRACLPIASSLPVLEPLSRHLAYCLLYAHFLTASWPVPLRKNLLKTSLYRSWATACALWSILEPWRMVHVPDLQGILLDRSGRHRSPFIFHCQLKHHKVSKIQSPGGDYSPLFCPNVRRLASPPPVNTYQHFCVVLYNHWHPVPSTRSDSLQGLTWAPTYYWLCQRIPQTPGGDLDQGDGLPMYCIIANAFCRSCRAK